VRSFARTLVLAVAVAVGGTALAADARERGSLHAGMPEREVLQRVGPPDEETFVRNVRGEPEVKRWTYRPHPRDAQTVTVVTLRAGVVTRVDRRIER
jgi:hypothetical protein